MPPGPTHREHEDNPWTIEIGDHPSRRDSPGYVRSRKLMIELVQSAQPWFLGARPYQDHHGGGIWVKDLDGWLLVLGLAGIEWSAQFCADPVKVDQLRVAAARMVRGFPATLEGYAALGYLGAKTLLTTPIVDATTIAAWTDGIFNASVALPAPLHTGVLPAGAGYHHYPKPIVDILTFKHDDFVLFVTDAAGNPLAVTPVGPRGSGDGRVTVVWAQPGSPMALEQVTAERSGSRLVLASDSPAARLAFVHQE
jgi:hypothetical protein